MLESQTGRLLLVDDEPRNTRLLSDIFQSQGFDVLQVNESLSVMEKVEDYEPDVIILDVMMPGKTGFDLAREIKSEQRWQHIPIVLLTALSDRDSCIAGLECGAEDYVAKPFNRRELSARIKNLLRLKKLHDFQNHNARLLVKYDQVTGLPKKEIMLQFAETLIKKSSQVTVAICEVEFYQNLFGILDFQGKENTENRISRAIVERMASVFPPGILLGVLGEGKFAIILEACENSALPLLKTLQERLRAPFVVQSQELYLDFCIGYMPVQSTEENWKAIFNKTELAVLEAKKKGCHQLKRFEPEMDTDNYDRWWLSQALIQALRGDQLMLYYQPQVDMLNKKLLGFEALIRWKHPDRGFISPLEFIPLAEDSGIIYDIGLWVIDQACQQLSSWRDQGLTTRLAVNISAVQLHQQNFTVDLISLLAKYDLAPSNFELELTESCLMDPESGDQLRALWDQGFDIAIDDFGTGFCNLEYLKKYPFNRLKIDRCFIANLCESADDLAIVKAILAIAEQMGSRVITEGVETERQAVKMCNLGCSEAQGFYYSRPIPVNEATELLKKGMLTV